MLFILWTVELSCVFFAKKHSQGLWPVASFSLCAFAVPALPTTERERERGKVSKAGPLRPHALGAHEAAAPVTVV